MLLLLPVSYFYNLSVLNYSIKGDNELRLYDLLGLVLFFFFIKHYKAVSTVIMKIIFFRRFWYFVMYCSVSILLTLVVALSKNKLTWFLQSFLYLYHMWVFFLGAVFVFFYLHNQTRYRNYIMLVAGLVILEGVIVILQNLGLIPFLWNERYRIGYAGFLSGTLGPNKIVLGMMMLLSFILFVGILYQKGLKVPRFTVYGGLAIAVIAILLSGSRTSYLGAVIFLGYFFMTRTGKFINFGIIVGMALGVLVLVNPSLIDRIDQVISGRITEQITRPEELNSLEGLSGVYVDLGAGRSELHSRYVRYLFANPYVFPVGIGFNNRLVLRFSAHNMYLSLVKELGIIGLILFIRWLLAYLVIVKKKKPQLQMALNGLVLAMFVTLYFGEHLYIYRPLFGILGYFMLVCVLFLAPYKKLE